MSVEQLIKSILRFRVILSLLIVVVTMAWLLPLSKMGVEMDNRPERFAPADDPAFDDMEEIALLLEKYKFSSIPVLDEREVLQGVITSDDVMEELISLTWTKYKDQI